MELCQLNGNYDPRNEIIYNTKLLKSNLYDYNNAYILVKYDITIVGDDGTPQIVHHTYRVSQNVMAQQ